MRLAMAVAESNASPVIGEFPKSIIALAGISQGDETARQNKERARADRLRSA
jgi:hypothetical protein